MIAQLETLLKFIDKQDIKMKKYQYFGCGG
jgi:hypothetical protein